MNFPDFEKFNLNIKTETETSHYTVMTEQIKKPKTLLEIQNEVAKEYNNMLWSDLHLYETRNKLWPEVCRRAQLECARETLKEASKKAELIHCGNKMKEAITDEANIKLIQ